MYLLLNLSNKVRDLVAFYQDSCCQWFAPRQMQEFLHTHTHTSTPILFLSPNHLQSHLCPPPAPASQHPERPSYKLNEFHGTAAVTSDYQVAQLYSSLLINRNHLPENMFIPRQTEPHAGMPNQTHFRSSASS